VVRPAARQKMALTPAQQPADLLMRRTCCPRNGMLNCIRQLFVGNPCQRSCSTMPSSAHSIQPSSWRSLHCNRRAGQWCRPARNHCPAQGSPCRAPCSTMPSCLRTSLPANWQNHRRNCRGQQEAQSPAAPWGAVSGSPCGALGSTKPSSVLPITTLSPRHN